MAETFLGAAIISSGVAMSAVSLVGSWIGWVDVSLVSTGGLYFSVCWYLGSSSGGLMVASVVVLASVSSAGDGPSSSGDAVNRSVGMVLGCTIPASDVWSLCVPGVAAVGVLPVSVGMSI